MRLTVAIRILLPACLAGTGACGDGGLERAKRECTAGNAAACRVQGELHLSGAGGVKSRKQGREALERACDLGDGAACGLAGSLNYARRDREARDRFQRACDLGHLGSCTTWAWMMLHKEGGAADPAGARATFDKACRGNEAAACVFAALTGDEPEPIDGRDASCRRDEYLERACALGDRQSCERRSRR